MTDCAYCPQPVYNKTLLLCEMHNRRRLRGQDMFAPKRTGGPVRYQMAHLRVYKTRGKASQYVCVDCGDPAEEWSYNGGDPNEQISDDPRHPGSRYSSHPDFYAPRCVHCHRKHDLGRDSNH